MAGLVGDLVVRAVGVAASMALGFLVLAELLSMQLHRQDGGLLTGTAPEAGIAGPYHPIGCPLVCSSNHDLSGAK